MRLDIAGGRWLLPLFILSVGLTACRASQPPAAPIVRLGFGVKELRFAWTAVSGASFYRVLEKPDGVSGYTQVVTNLVALSYNHTIPVHRRLNASYIVEACNKAGCTASAAQIPGADLTKAIGYIKSSNSGKNDGFGKSIALSGDGNTLAVGAWYDLSNTTGINSTPNESGLAVGAVYVFTRIAGAWSQQAYVKASNGRDNDQFGGSVALSSDGNTLAVGAWGESSSTTGINSTPNDSAIDAGAGYVFTRDSGAWSQQAYVKASNPAREYKFGISVALSGDGNTLAVGAPDEASSSSGVNSTPDQFGFSPGAAYVFIRNAGVWSQQAYVKASNTGNHDHFGWAVALSGDGNTLVVGAPGEGNTIHSTSTFHGHGPGAAYVFTRSGGFWAQQAYVKASKPGPGDEFGREVALSIDGNTLAIGAPNESSSTTGINSTPNEAASSAGAAYVFARSAGAWSQQAYVKASNTGPENEFGILLALSGDGNTLAVCEISEASRSGSNSKPDKAARRDVAVYIYTSRAGVWSQQADVKAGGPVALSSDGNTLAIPALSESSSTTGIDSTPNKSGRGAGAVNLY